MCKVVECKAGEGSRCVHTNVMCTNCKGFYYVISSIGLAKKQALVLAWSGRKEWRILEQEKLQKREKEEATENAKEAEARIQVVATVEQWERDELARPKTRDEDNIHLRIRDTSGVQETQGLEASREANTIHRSAETIAHESGTTKLQPLLHYIHGHLQRSKCKRG